MCRLTAGDRGIDGRDKADGTTEEDRLTGRFGKEKRFVGCELPEGKHFARRTWKAERKHGSPGLWGPETVGGWLAGWLAG